MSVTADDLERIVIEVWRDVLGEEAAPADPPPAVDYTACVQITGAFRGAVILQVPRAVAVAAAAAMFAIPPAEVGEAEAGDALGELANMVSGHVKTLVAAPSQLALPVVIPGAHHGLHRCRLELLAERAMAAAAGPMLVRVYEDIADEP